MKVSFRLDVEGKGGSLCEIVRRGEENGEERANGLKRDTWPRDKRKDGSNADRGRTRAEANTRIPR